MRSTDLTESTKKTERTVKGKPSSSLRLSSSISYFLATDLSASAMIGYEICNTINPWNLPSGVCRTPICHQPIFHVFSIGRMIVQLLEHPVFLALEPLFAIPTIQWCRQE